MSRAAVFMIAVLCLSGCARDPLDVDCPAVAAGDLVVSEVRGKQSGDDAYGEWIEVYNASPRPVDLQGLKVTITRLDGSSTLGFNVREPLVLAPDDFAVLGRFAPSALPEHVDYGYLIEADTSLFDTGAIELDVCGSPVDLAIYRNLPSRGTLGLDGTSAPSAEANDNEMLWCIDEEEDAQSPDQGVRGTPGARNRPCT